MSVVGISCMYVDDVQRNIGNAKKAINDVKADLNSARSKLSPHSGNSRISADYSTINSKINRLDSDITSLNNFQQKFNNFVSEVKEADSRCARSIKANSQVYNSANGIPNRPVMAAIAGLLNKSLNIVKKLLNLVLNPLGSIMIMVGTIFKDNIKDFYSKNIKPWLDKGKELFSQFKTWIKNSYKYIKIKFKELIKNAITITLLPFKIGNAIRKEILSIGSNIITNVWKWFKENKDTIVNVGKAVLKIGFGVATVAASGILTVLSGGTLSIGMVGMAVFGANDIVSGIVDLINCNNPDYESFNLIKDSSLFLVDKTIDFISKALFGEVDMSIKTKIMAGANIVYYATELIIGGGIIKNGMATAGDDIMEFIIKRKELLTDAMRVPAEVVNVIGQGLNDKQYRQMMIQLGEMALGSTAKSKKSDDIKAGIQLLIESKSSKNYGDVMLSLTLLGEELREYKKLNYAANNVKRAWNNLKNDYKNIVLNLADLNAKVVYSD